MFRMNTLKLALSLFCAISMMHAYSWRVTAAETVELTSQSKVLQDGKSHELSGRWIEAIDLYEKGLKKWPEDADLKYHLRISKIQFGIERRYEDDSFDQDLVKQSRSDALSLYDSVFTRVQGFYVDRLSPTSYVAHGTESLYYALSNKKFVEQNLPRATPEQIRSVKNTLYQEYWNKPVRDQYSARLIIEQVCDLVRQQLQMSHGPVVMEFLFGGCNALDDYSNFLTPDRLEDLYGNIEGQFVGLGIEMKAELGKGMHLVDVLPGSPAEAGGLIPEEFIVGIDGVNCRDMSTDEAARLLRGPENSRVRLDIFDELHDNIRQREFIRRPVDVHSVTIAKIVDADNGTGYIKMTGFQKGTAQEMDEALVSLTNQGMRSLIWDLRGNPGGLLTAAVEVLDRFIDQGVIVETRGRSSDQNWVYRAHHNSQHRTYENLPLVLLVDGNSASASEIVAGALRDHNRGQIIGRKTYGKWSVQSIYPIGGIPGQANSKTGLRITTARFFSPNGNTYSKIGVEPNIEVAESEEVVTSFYRGAFDEKYKSDPDIKRGMQELREHLSLRK
ncbi:putative CtpA-like serine protease [Polystyrenella longa]|uniref:Putative CtpA-like serine protease n=1 Tax=Polystyrenella longa TaxID=2528007 RepID=A0A518CNT8_9PLAN|nr:S41 family peptidase [Polystyrenella longa]QDU80883.1 putative CtpA-like serine protease [Polystyrenella longa]